MQTQLTMSSFSSSAYGCYWYPHYHLPQIAAKSSIAKRKLAFSQAQKHGPSNSESEVVNDGMDCVPNYKFKCPWANLLKPRDRFSIPESELVNDGMDCLPNRKTPWIKLCAELDTKEGVIMDAFYSVAEHRVVRLNRRTCLGVPATAKCFASVGEWLGFINPIDNLEMYLVNPFFSDKDMGVIRLPCLTSIPSCVGVERDPETGNVMVKLADYADFVRESVTPEVAASYITNLAISHSDPRHVDCVVAALQGKGIRRLAYSRIWDDKTGSRWIGLQEGCPPFNRHKQLVFSHSRKLFYTINNNGIEAFDLHLLGDNDKTNKGSSSSSSKRRRRRRRWVFPNEIIEKELWKEFELEQDREWKCMRMNAATGKSLKPRDSKFYRRYHLVMLDEPEPGESSQLLLIVRHLFDMVEVLDDSTPLHVPIKNGEVTTLHFDVFKVIFETRHRRLERVKSLGDYCLFVSGNNCFSLRASRVPGLLPNSIYFTYTHPLESSKTWNLQCGIFNVGNNEFGRIFWDYDPEAPIHQCEFTNFQHLWKYGYELFWVSPSNIIP